MSDEFKYPKRPKFFALKFCRITMKACLANDIGQGAVLMLQFIAMTEDARGYRSEVSFFNEHLASVAGFSSVAAMDRARAKAIRSGWLKHKKGGKGIAGKYYVDIPELHRDWDDNPTDEEHDPSIYLLTGEETTGREPEENLKTSEREAEDNRKTNSEHSSLSPIPIPIPRESSTPAPALDSAFEEFWKLYPRRENRSRAKAAFLTAADGCDLTALIASIRAALAWQVLLPQWADPGFIPLPANWLNDCRWHDEKPTATLPKPPPYEPAANGRHGDTVPAGPNRPFATQIETTAEEIRANEQTQPQAIREAKRRMREREQEQRKTAEMAESGAAA